jgi:hypothetical protein
MYACPDRLELHSKHFLNRLNSMEPGFKPMSGLFVCHFGATIFRNCLLIRRNWPLMQRNRLPMCRTRFLMLRKCLLMGGNRLFMRRNRFLMPGNCPLMHWNWQFMGRKLPPMSANH